MELLEIKDLTKRFRGLVAIDSVNFKVREGEIVGLIGPNGAGKSTLFDMISGIKPPDNSSPFPDLGEIYFMGKNITRLPPYTRCKLGIGRTFQLTRPLSEMRVIENVSVALMFGRDVEKSSKKKLMKRAEEICNFVGLGDKISKFAGSLGVLDRKKLELARALATRPKLLLLDEIMAGLNPTEIVDACNLVKSIRASNVTVLVVEHILKAIMSISDRIIVMDHGKKIAEGLPQEVTNNRRVIKAYLGEEATNE